jgi:hypothetical protein
MVGAYIPCAYLILIYEYHVVNFIPISRLSLQDCGIIQGHQIADMWRDKLVLSIRNLELLEMLHLLYEIHEILLEYKFATDDNLSERRQASLAQVQNGSPRPNANLISAICEGELKLLQIVEVKTVEKVPDDCRMSVDEHGELADVRMI